MMKFEEEEENPEELEEEGLFISGYGLEAKAASESKYQTQSRYA